MVLYRRKGQKLRPHFGIKKFLNIQNIDFLPGWVPVICRTFNSPFVLLVPFSANPNTGVSVPFCVSPIPELTFHRSDFGQQREHNHLHCLLMTWDCSTESVGLEEYPNSPCGAP